MILGSLRRRATIFLVSFIVLVGISQACSERVIDPVSPDLFTLRLDSVPKEAQQLDPVTVEACPSDMVGTYPDCYYENPPPSGPGCDANFDPNCGETDPCEIDPFGPGCSGDPCTTDPYAAGCDPCAVDPYLPECSPPDEGTPPPEDAPPEGVNADWYWALNTQEKALCKRDRFNCARVYDMSYFAFWWSDDKPAYCNGNPNEGVGQNDERDALRHAIWQAQLARHLGEAYAKEWGDAHESVYSPTNPASVMDQHNNAVGREVARDGGDLEVGVLQAFNGGRLTWLVSCDFE